MSSREPVELPIHALVEEVPFRNAGINWSYAVDGLLNELVTSANEHGAKTNRRELAAAIICSVDHDRLLDIVLRYRLLRVGDLQVNPVGDDTIIRVERFGPGPRAVGNSAG